MVTNMVQVAIVLSLTNFRSLFLIVSFFFYTLFLFSSPPSTCRPDG